MRWGRSTRGDLSRSPTSSLCLDSACFPGSSNPKPGLPSPPQAPLLKPRGSLALTPTLLLPSVEPSAPTNTSILPLLTVSPPTYPAPLRKAFRRGTHGCRRPRAGQWVSAHSCPGTRRMWRHFPGPGCALGMANRGAAERTSCKSLGDRLRGGAM